MPASAAARPDLADLILLRLLPEKKSVGVNALRKDLAVFFRRALSADEVGRAVGTLRADGYVAAKGQRSTAAGRARALQFLGVANLPARANWGAVKAKYLVPRALGLSPDSAEYAKAVGSGETFAAFLLKRQLGLSESTGRTLTAVVDALVCRELGHPEFTTLNDLIAFALGRAVGGDPIAKADAKKVLPRVRLNVTQLSTEKLFAVVLGGGIATDDGDEPFDLEMFANTVKSVARTCPTGRFGGYKVFINHVWNQLRDEPRFAPLGLDGFKQKLVAANRANLLTLSRAELVQLMDPADVRESETTFLTATFHFILVEKD
jgi:hypothetical protein